MEQKKKTLNIYHKARTSQKIKNRPKYYELFQQPYKEDWPGELLFDEKIDNDISTRILLELWKKINRGKTQLKRSYPPNIN